MQYKAAKQQAVSALIRRAWTQAQAKELGVSVSESEVAKQLEVREASQKALAKSARSREFLAEAPRYTGTDLKEMITSELLEERISTKIREKFTTSGSVSQSKLEKYFNEHKQTYARPESRSIVFATSKSQSIAEALAKEHSGATFRAPRASTASKRRPPRWAVSGRAGPKARGPRLWPKRSAPRRAVSSLLP